MLWSANVLWEVGNYHVFSQILFYRKAAGRLTPDSVIYEVVLEKRNGALGIVTAVSISLKKKKKNIVLLLQLICFVFLFGGFFLAVGIIFKEKVTHFVLSD